MVNIASGNEHLEPIYREIQFIQWFFVTALIDSECCICVSTQGHVLPGVRTPCNVPLWPDSKPVSCSGSKLPSLNLDRHFGTCLAIDFSSILSWTLSAHHSDLCMHLESAAPDIVIRHTLAHA